mmetsp:Transcript_54112/g.124044  ORF Transcript_54112/g.124044 Transcript_54112/m.124044 type:complete len:230 (-) Transcript_54112:239-928(-)
MLLGDYDTVPHMARRQLRRQHRGFSSPCPVLRVVQEFQSQLIRLVHLVLGSSDHEIRRFTPVLWLVEAQVRPRFALQTINGFTALPDHVPNMLHRHGNLNLYDPICAAGVPRSVVGRCCSSASVHTPGVGAPSTLLSGSLFTQRVLEFDHALLDQRLCFGDRLVGATHNQVPHSRIGFIQLHTAAAVFSDAINVLASCTDHSADSIRVDPNGIAVAIIQPPGRAASSAP